MGSGERFSIKLMRGISFGVFYFRWPHQHSFVIHFLCFAVNLGFGPGYDEFGYKQ